MPQPRKRVSTGKSQSGSGKSSTPRANAGRAKSPTRAARGTSGGKAVRAVKSTAKTPGKVSSGPGQAKSGHSRTPKSASRTMAPPTRAARAASVVNKVGGASVGPVRVASHDITVSGRIHQAQPRHVNLRVSGRRASVSLHVKRAGDTRALLSGHASTQHRDSHGRFS